MRRGLLPNSLLLLLAAAFGTASAQTAPDAPRLQDRATLYFGQGADLNLREVPEAIFTGDLRRESSFFWGLGYSRTLNTLGGSSAGLRSTFVENVEHGYEVLLLKHHGRQDNVELGAAYMLRSPNAELGPVRVNFAAGAGLSHAFGTPSYEDGSKSDPDRRYRTQFLALFELEWGVAGAPNFALVTRVHHRSGVYGLIAPSGVGSNFFVAGVRYKF